MWILGLFNACTFCVGSPLRVASRASACRAVPRSAPVLRATGSSTGRPSAEDIAPRTSRQGHRGGGQGIREAVRLRPPTGEPRDSLAIHRIGSRPATRFIARHASSTRDIRQLTSSMTVVLAVAYARGPGSPTSARDGPAGDEVNQEAMECLRCRRDPLGHPSASGPGGIRS